MYADLAAASTPEEVMSLLESKGASLTYDEPAPEDQGPPMDAPPGDETGDAEGPMSEEYSDGGGMPETGRRATILSIVKKNLNKNGKPGDDEGSEKEE